MRSPTVSLGLLAFWGLRYLELYTSGIIATATGTRDPLFALTLDAGILLSALETSQGLRTELFTNVLAKRKWLSLFGTSGPGNLQFLCRQFTRHSSFGANVYDIFQLEPGYIVLQGLETYQERV